MQVTQVWSRGELAASSFVIGTLGAAFALVTGTGAGAEEAEALACDEEAAGAVACNSCIEYPAAGALIA